MELTMGDDNASISKCGAVRGLDSSKFRAEFLLRQKTMLIELHSTDFNLNASRLRTEGMIQPQVGETASVGRAFQLLEHLHCIQPEE
ncbi:MAG: hypothetical protein SGARI_000467 [Bacillariaceae sp.]